MRERTMLTEYLALLPAAALARGLRESEEDVVCAMRGTPLELITAYRLVGRSLKRDGRIPAYAELPARLTQALFGRRGNGGPRRGRTLDGERYAKLARAVEATVGRLAEFQIAMEYVTDVKFEDDPDLERARRGWIYARRAAELDRRYRHWLRTRQGPYARAVRCEELDMPFASARAAARWLRDTAGLRVEPAHIRTAMNRGEGRGRCGGLTWRRDDGQGGGGGEPQRRLQPTGRERPVRCRQLGDARPFASVAAAAAFANASPSRLATVLREAGRGTLNGFDFEYVDRPAPAAVARPFAAAAAQLDLFSILAKEGA